MDPVTPRQSAAHPIAYVQEQPNDEVVVGEYVAVKSDKYDERPLLGRVTAAYENNFQMDGKLYWNVEGMEE